MNSTTNALRMTFMTKIPTQEDIDRTCNDLAEKLATSEASRNDVKIALVDVLEEALQGQTCICNKSLTLSYYIDILHKHAFNNLFYSFPSDIMQYEADQNMVFNYLMVSGLAAATDLFEKNGTGMTGGKSFNQYY